MKKAFFAAPCAAFLFAAAAFVPAVAFAQNDPAGVSPFSAPGYMGPSGGLIQQSSNALQQSGNQQLLNSVIGGDSCTNLRNSGLKGIVGCIKDYMSIAVTLIMSAAIVVIVWGAFTMIYSEEKRESGRQTVVWGIIGLFAMVSIWGLVNILDSTFRLSGGTPIAPPKFGP
jgi:hypothetical protein